MKKWSMFFVYTEEEVKEVIREIYIEFAELPIKSHTTKSLKQIIKKVVEERKDRPLKILL